MSERGQTETGEREREREIEREREGESTLLHSAWTVVSCNSCKLYTDPART